MPEDLSTLIIDRVTPVQPPSEEQLKRWAHRQRVFISSTMDDLADVRQAIANAVSEFGAQPVVFETFGARSDDSRQSYTTEVRRSQVYLGILSRLYGIKLPSGYSATHEEYEEARKHRKEILLFLDGQVPDSERDGHLNRWITELYQFHVLAKYKDTKDLNRHVKTSLAELAADELTPWVKFDRLVFQATRINKTIRDQVTTVTLTTACQDPHVTSALVGMLGERFGRNIRQFTFGRDSLPVQIENVAETIDPLGNDTLALTCRTVQNQSHSQQWQSSMLLLGSYSGPTGNYQHRDLVEIALRGVVLGEAPPQDPLLRSFLVTNFKSLYRQYGDDVRVFSKILRLLIVEAVYQQALVDQIVFISVGRVRDNKVHVGIEALLPKAYSNVELETVALEGDVDLL